MSVQTYLVLLRGVNVSGHNLIKMADLREHLTNAGFNGVRTYIQSGNLLIDSNLPAVQAAQKVSGVLQEEFDIRAEIFCLSAAQLDAVIETNPFSMIEDHSKVHLVLTGSLAAEVLSNAVKAADFENEFAVAGKDCIYLHLPNGSGRAKMTVSYWEKKLAAKATARNWRTILRLQKMMKEGQDE